MLWKSFWRNKILEIQLLNSWRQKFKIQISSASCSSTRRHNSRANFKFKNFMTPSSGKTFQLSLTGAKIETFNSQKLTFQFFFFFKKKKTKTKTRQTGSPKVAKLSNFQKNRQRCQVGHLDPTTEWNFTQIVNIRIIVITLNFITKSPLRCGFWNWKSGDRMRKIRTEKWKLESEIFHWSIQREFNQLVV